MCLTTPQCTFSCLVHSRLPSRFCSPVQLFRLFFPLSTHVYQTHAEGRGCLPFTREAGVGDTACAVSFTCMDVQLRKSIDPSTSSGPAFRRSSPILTDSFERTGRSPIGHTSAIESVVENVVCRSSLAVALRGGLPPDVGRDFVPTYIRRFWLLFAPKNDRATLRLRNPC